MKVSHQIEKDAGSKSLALKVDVGNSSQVNKAVRKVKDLFKKIDILVNNAAYVRYSPFVKFSEKDWDQVINICLKGYFICGQAVAKEMIRHKGGKIINIASVAGYMAFAGATAYGTAKGGVIALTRIMALELARYNIIVNAIAPGPILTPLLEGTLTKGDKDARLERIPAGRLGRPEDIIGPAVFLASGDSNYVYGHILVVDGGFSAAAILRRYG
jgi:NAD(P)-dependent dehydrogenase (short-subunit alcohol dehydrogenase family)